MTFEWLHGFAEIIDPLLRRGLRLDFLHELPVHVPDSSSSSSRRTTRGWLRVKGHHERLPPELHAAR